VRLLASGQALLAPSVTRRLLDLRARTLNPIPSETRNAALAAITARELTVLRLVARGLSNTAIALEMELATSSVKTHVGHLLAKLGFTDRVQLVVFAYEQELVRPGATLREAAEPERPRPPSGVGHPPPYRDGAA
jgi:DNA-binding NarL/FixJ family response regulator